MTSIAKICKNRKDIAALEAKMATLKEHRQVYSLDGAVLGFKAETWGPREGNQNPGNQAAFDAQWIAASNGGLMHVSGSDPDTTVLETDTRFSPAERGNDDHKLTYCIDNRDSLIDLEIIDTDARAESLAVYVGCTCSMAQSYIRYQANDAGQNQPPYTSDGQVVATIPAGQVRIMCVYIHDPGPDFSGFRPIANYAGSEDTVAFISYQEKPTVSCKIIEQLLCEDPYILAANESFKPIELTCTQCPSGFVNTPDAGDESTLSVQLAIQGTRHPQSTDTTASVINVGIYE